MLCPRCHRTLERHFYRDKLHFSCPGCSGKVLTFAGLRSLCGDPELLRALWRLSGEEPAREGVLCPECGEAMTRVRLPLLPEGPELELDVCRKSRCQLVWFDAGEFEALPEAIPPQAKEELPPEAREKLAVLAAGRVAERAAGEMPPTPVCLLAFFGIPAKGSGWSGRFPWITAAVSLLSVAVFLLTRRDLPGAFREWGLIPADPWRHGGATWFTSMVLHSGWGHLVGNLAFFAVFGDSVEAALKKHRYLLLILGGGLAAGAVHCLWGRGPALPCGGASGFVSAVLGCFAVLFPREPLTVFFRWHPVTLPAWLYIGGWFLLQLIAARASSPLTGGTAFMAHVGGAAAGALAGAVLLLRQRDAEFRTEGSG